MPVEVFPCVREMRRSSKWIWISFPSADFVLLISLSTEETKQHEEEKDDDGCRIKTNAWARQISKSAVRISLKDLGLELLIDPLDSKIFTTLHFDTFQKIKKLFETCLIFTLSLVSSQQTGTEHAAIQSYFKHLSHSWFLPAIVKTALYPWNEGA